MSSTGYTEDWGGFPAGHIPRDNSARGEYMCASIADNPNGWYQPSAPGWGARSFGRELSTWEIVPAPEGAGLRQHSHATTDALCLTRRDRHYQDCTVSTALTIEGNELCGVTGRYSSSRDFYCAGIEQGMLKLLKRIEGIWTLLAQKAIQPDRSMELALDCSGPRLTVSVNGQEELTAADGSLTAGMTGLIANAPARFGRVTVTSADNTAVPEIHTWNRAFPAAELALEIDITGYACGRQIRFADLDGDGRSEIILALPDQVKGRQWTYNSIGLLTAMDLDGKIVWSAGQRPDAMRDITADLPLQAADRGRGMEIVTCFTDRLQIRDPLTGKVTKETETPAPPVMEPYWDEIQQYFGDGHGDDLPHLVPDSIRLCNLTGRGAWNDLLIKDRYHNAWGIDGTTLKPLWHHRCNIGHFPFTWDPDGTGRDTVILGYSRLDADGRLKGRLFLGDHPDGCFAYEEPGGLRHIMHPAGEAGLIDERSDGHIAEIHLGHVQHLSVASFRRDLPGLERIIVTYHHGEGIIVMLDSRNRILRKTEEYNRGTVCQPVNWTGDGTELIAFSAKRGSGGLWNSDFECVVPLPDTDRPEHCLEVHDVLGLGVDQLIVWDDRKLQVYRPASIPETIRYRPLRPHPNMSNYQVNYSLPQ